PPVMQDLTTGSVSAHLLRTTSFMLVTMLFQTLYFLVDLYWVGHLGKEAVAAVGISGNLMFIVLAVTQMLGVGTTTLVSHAAGRKEHDRALLVFNQSQVLSVLTGVLFFLLMMALRPIYARGLSADARTAGLASDYLLWFIPASALQFGMVAMGAALRGTGNFKPGMVVQSVTVILNMILAPFLIFGWVTHRPLGVAGAALATFVAVAVGTIWLAFYFRPHESYLKFMRHDWRPRLDLWAYTLRIGLPAGAEFSLDAQVLAVGDEYLRILSWNFVASGVVFVSSSMFQAMGNTIPSLLSSFTRITVVAIPAVLLSRVAGFQLHWIWYLSVLAVGL